MSETAASAEVKAQAREQAASTIDAATAIEPTLRESGQRRQQQALTGSDGISETLLAVAFLIGASAAAILTSAPLDLDEAAFYALVYAVVSLVRFDVGAGYTMPTVLVLVPMLFVFDPAWVPTLVGIGLILGQVPMIASGRARADRAVVSALANAWHVAPAVTVFLIADVHGPPSLNEWWLYLAAFGAQLIFDVALSLLRERGLPIRVHLRHVRLSVTSDALLIPVGLLLAAACAASPYALALMLPLLVLFQGFVRERRDRVTGALAIQAQALRRRMLHQRMQVAADLHETLAQVLAESMMLIDLARDDPTHSAELLDRAHGSLENGQRSMQTMIRALRGEEDVTLGMTGAISELAVPLLESGRGLTFDASLSALPRRNLRAGVLTLLAAVVEVAGERAGRGEQANVLGLDICEDKLILRVGCDQLDDEERYLRRHAQINELAAGLDASLTLPGPAAMLYYVEVNAPFGGA